MGNDFINYLSLITSYSKKDIQLQFVFSCIVSLLYIVIIKILLKKIPVTVCYKKQYLSCGFLITLIFNFVSPYSSVIVSNHYFLNTAFNIINIIIILLVLSLIELLIVYPLASEKLHLRKFLIWQAITIPIFSLIINGFTFAIIILISSFM